MMRKIVLFAALAFAALAAAEEELAPPFNKEELEAVLRKDHSQRVSNIYDPNTDTQYTWDVENQELCALLPARR